MVNSSGQTVLARQTLGEFDAVLRQTQDVTTQLKLSSKVLPGTVETTLDVAETVAIQRAAAIEGSGFVRATTVTSGSISPTLARGLSVLKNPVTGGFH